MCKFCMLEELLLKKMYIFLTLVNPIVRRMIMENMQKILLILTILGAVNWGLVGLFDLNLVSSLFGSMTVITRIIYTLIAVAGVVNIGILFNHLEVTD